MNAQPTGRSRSAWGVFVVLLLAGHSAGAASLTGSFASIQSGTTIDLTLEGPVDWVHWGLYTETSLTRKAGVAPLINNFTRLVASNSYNFIYQFSDNYNGYSWSDGTPTASVTNTTTGVWAYGGSTPGTGFQITVPADSTQRVLKLYVGAYAASGKIEAFLSDQSARPYTDSSLTNAGNGESAVYSISYAAQSAGQTLTINWTLLQGSRGDANVTLQAAALSVPGANLPPILNIASPDDNATFSAGSDISVTATADDPDGSIAQVEFFAGSTRIGQAASSPFTMTWTNVPAGDYVLTAMATDDGGASRVSAPIEVFVSGTGGGLSAAAAFQQGNEVNLTTEGSSDWAHWGLTSANSFNHKAGVAQQITDFTKIGSGTVKQYSDNVTAYSWTDGTRTGSAASTRTGVSLHGLANGFQINLPADRGPRTLKVYLGLYGAQGIFRARLSDASAPVYTDTSLGSIYGNIYAIYTLDYMAASAGQSLLVQYTSKTLFDDTYGIVTWQAATMFPNSPPSISITSPTNNVAFSAPANITITADPSDSDGTIAKVEFFQGDTWLGEAGATSSYSLVWSNVPAGSYTLTARATDNNAAVTTSSPVNISVTGIEPLAVTLVNPAASETQFDFAFVSELNRTYTVERTLTLNPIGWQTVTNVIGDGGVMTVIDSVRTGAQRYYRVVSQ